jgi:hypothetical protein
MNLYNNWRSYLQKGQGASGSLVSVRLVVSDLGKQSINLHYIRKMAVGIGAVAAVFFGMHHSAQALGPQQNFVSATQSSPVNSSDSSPATNAIDGNLSTFNHTGKADGEWWVGDLGRLVNIEQITVHNRGSCCQSRLNSRVYVFINDPRPLIKDQPFNEVMDILDKMREPYSNSANGASGGPLFNFNPSSGDVGPARYVMLIQQNSDYLHLDEVIVHGEAFTRGKGAGGVGYRFNSNSARLTIGNDKEVDIDNHWSISARFNDLKNGNSFRTLFRGKAGDHQVIIDSSGMLGTYCNTGSCKQGQSGRFFSTGFDMDVFDDGQTHTITAVGSGDTTTFYVDGFEVGSVPVKSETDIYAIGNYQGGGQPFALLIDDVQIHRVALTPAEIIRIARSDVVTRGLVSHFDAEGSTGSESLIDDAFSPRVLTVTASVASWAMPAAYHDELYLDDTLPPYANINGNEVVSGQWPWVYDDTIDTTEINPLSGYYHHNYGVDAGSSNWQHYVQGLNYTVKRDDVFSTWVRTVSGSVPLGVQIQINSNGWKRAHWGQAPYTPSKRLNMQAPSYDGWVNLKVSLEDFGIKEGDPITGIAFTHKGGMVAWDNTHIGGGLHAQGLVSIEKWNNIAGFTLQDLFDDDRYPYSPDERVSNTAAEMYGTEVGSNHAVKISGFITPPATGDYTFWIASDDQGVLRLSSNDQPGAMADAAFVPSWTSYRDWNKFPEQQSTARTLTAGKRYYFEAIAKESGGGDNLSIAWQGPGISQQVISSQYLSLPIDTQELWRHCAVNQVTSTSSEGCFLPIGTTGTIRFGAYGQYEYLYNVKSSIYSSTFCNVETFGSDPLPGKTKQCEYKVTGSNHKYHGDRVHGEAINFHNYTTRSYGGGQDVPSTGIAIVEDDGATLHMEGNRWQQIDLHQPYQVTGDTYLEFDFSSTTQGEIQGIGFDDDDALSSSWFFQVYGTQSWGNQSFNNYSSGTTHYKIKVGDYFTGSFSQMFFAGDDDSAVYGNQKFSNVKLYEEHQGATKHKLSSKAGDVYFDLGDKLEGPNGYYARIDYDGNLEVTNGSTVYWESQTSQSALQDQTVRQSAYHAQCDTSVTDGCLPGDTLVVADDGVRIVDENGQIVWRPDLGDLSGSTEGLSVKIKMLESSHGTNHPSLVIIDNKTQRHIWDSHYGYHPRLQTHAEVLVTPTNFINERFFKNPPMGNASVYRKGLQTYSAVSYGDQIFNSNADGVVGSPFRYISEQDTARGPDYVDNAKLEKGILKNLKGDIDYLYSELHVEGNGNRVVYRAYVTNDGQLKVEKGILDSDHHSTYLARLIGLGHSMAIHTAYTEAGAPYTDVSTSGTVGANGDYYLIMTPKGFEIRNAQTHAVHWNKDVSMRALGDSDGAGKDPSAGIGSYMLTVNHSVGRLELYQSDYTTVTTIYAGSTIVDSNYPSSASAWHSDLSWGAAINTFSESAEQEVANFVVGKFERLYGDLQTLTTDVASETRALIHDIRRIPGDGKDHKIVNLSELLATYNDLRQLTVDIVEDGLDVAIDVADVALMVAAVMEPEFIVPLELAEKGFVTARSVIGVAEAVITAQHVTHGVHSMGELLDGVTEQMLKDEYGDNYRGDVENVFAVNHADDIVNDYGEHTASLEHANDFQHRRNQQQIADGDPVTPNNTLDNEFEQWGSSCNFWCRWMTKAPVLAFDVAAEGVLNRLQTGNSFGNRNTFWSKTNGNVRLSNIGVRFLFRYQPRLVKVSSDANAEYVKNNYSFILKTSFISSRLGAGGSGSFYSNHFFAGGLIDSTDWVFTRRLFQEKKPGSSRDDRANTIDFVSFGGALGFVDATLKSEAAASILSLGTIGVTAISSFFTAFAESLDGDSRNALQDVAAIIPTVGVVGATFLTDYIAQTRTGASVVGGPNGPVVTSPVDLELLAGVGTLTKHRFSDLDSKERTAVVMAHYVAPMVIAGVATASGLNTWVTNVLGISGTASTDVMMFGEYAMLSIVANMATIYGYPYYNGDGSTNSNHSNFKNSTFGVGGIASIAGLTAPNIGNIGDSTALNGGTATAGIFRPTADTVKYQHKRIAKFRGRTLTSFAYFKNIYGSPASKKWTFGN